MEVLVTKLNDAAADVPRCPRCGRYPIDHRNGVCLYPPSPDTGMLGELAALIHFRVGAWQDFGYEDPSTPDCKTIPPLGERSAEAITVGHQAIRDIDYLIGRLHNVRQALVSQLRRDEDIRMARPLPGIEGPAQ
jgi:hypothetical protein